LEPGKQVRNTENHDLSRRSFLGVWLGLVSLAVGAVLTSPFVRAMFRPLTARDQHSDWVDAGAVADYAAARVPVRRPIDVVQRNGWRASVYIVKVGSTLRALSPVCPHRGCTIAWDDNEGRFLCPCHGGVFAPDGAYESGPPPRSLDVLQTRVVGSRLLVRYQNFRSNVPVRQAIT